MRISDWSSDVCSSDLRRVDGVREEVAAVARFRNCRHSTSMLLPPKMRPVSDGNQCPRWWGGYSRAAGRKSSLSSFENGVRGARFPQLPLGSDTGPCPARLLACDSRHACSDGSGPGSQLGADAGTRTEDRRG